MSNHIISKRHHKPGAMRQPKFQIGDLVRWYNQGRHTIEQAEVVNIDHAHNKIIVISRGARRLVSVKRCEKDYDGS